METDEHKTPLPPGISPMPSPSTSTRRRAKRSTRFVRVGILIASLTLYAIYHYLTATNNENMDLSQYTDSIFLPFARKFNAHQVPQVMCTVEGVDIRMPIDTGSTGTLIGAPILPNISSDAGSPAHHFFTSSKILYIGRLVRLSMRFSGEAGSYATSTVSVLIVDKSWKCPWYDPKNDQFECPPGPNGEKAIERDTSEITYMGIGFGRNEAKDGMPYASPKINPFLNINAINGKSVSDRSMRAGYIISADGAHIGLTSKNTQAFAFATLEPGLTHAKDPRDWAMASMCFSINGEGKNCGTMLVDTGIAQMYIRADRRISIPTVIIPNPNPNGHARMVKRVKPGTEIGIGFPSLDRPATSYSFVVGDKSTIEPSYVFPQLPEHPPYVNTGRCLLFGYSVAFDAVGGRFGFRPAGNLGSSSVL
ncbi:outer membrane autotransporter barrel [Pyrenophora seminiperda CCB06]|uniref:Outer membrane autotransporter barrel n=1 Tax=Pyrenophora seminiperda CCB06 TaxID=1302712 RepID=A0A3M7M5F8_9PLEO|nr:outer membrane autotransporter barrel [Pyrenophora seminiperda CCB06]